MNEIFYKKGAAVAIKEAALPLWAYPAAAGLGALVGAGMGETPGIGALQGAVLAPAALLGGHAAWRHAARTAPTMKQWAAKMPFKVRKAYPTHKALRDAFKMEQLARRGTYAAGGGLAAGAGMYGLGSLGFGGMTDLIRAPGRAEKAREQQLMQMMQAQPAYY